MPELLTPAQQQLAERAQKFARDVLLRDADQKRMSRAQIVEAAKAAGFFGMTQPKAFGGSEAGNLELTIVREALASANASGADAVFGPAPGVLAHAEGALRETHLAPLLAGQLRGAFGFTEPDNAPQPTIAIADGGYWRVTGQKSYVTGGAEADFINTLVRIDGDKPALLVIDRNAPGVVQQSRFESLDGSHHAAFRFEDVRVPIHHLIGKPGEGMPRALQQIGDTRLQLAAVCTGWMLWCIRFLDAHLAGADRSGTLRGAKEGVRLRYAELRIQAYAARSMLYRTARLADSAENAINEAMATKVFATETASAIIDWSVQLVGGTALVVGHPLEALYRRVRALRLAEGASDVLRLNIARGALELGKGRI